MVKRSLQASVTGIKQAKKAFNNTDEFPEPAGQVETNIDVLVKKKRSQRYSKIKTQATSTNRDGAKSFC